MSRLEIGKEKIFIDGKPTKIISGAMHYFRVFPEYWEDRLIKLKEMGCNCVETYIIWNMHEKNEGEFDFSGRLDFVKFIQIATSLGLYVIVRPGPFICSEFEFGGLPWWLLKYDDIELRTYNKRYLFFFKRYIEEISKLLKPHMIDNGGNVIFVQVENEFGSYGDDKLYLTKVKEFFEENGINGPFIACDGECDYMLKNGMIPGVYEAVNTHWCEEGVKQLKKYQPDKPGAVMELWTDSDNKWGYKMYHLDLGEINNRVVQALENTELMNFYMYHGGTSFGYMNGTIYDGGKFCYYLTSYDRDAPINEYGKKTPKYYAVQKTICDYLGKEIVNQSPEPVLTNYGIANLVASMPLDKLDKKYYSSCVSKKPLSMEKVNQGYGYITYTKEIEIGANGAVLHVGNVHDKATIYIDGKYFHWFERDFATRRDIQLSGKHTLTIFVENLGRINHGTELMDYKGIIGDVVLYDKEKDTHTVLEDWVINSYEFDKGIEVIDTHKINGGLPALYKFEIDITPQTETYLEVKGFERGIVLFNGFNLGRHWNIGPQRSLFVPKSLLKNGKNEIIIFDVYHTNCQKEVVLHGKQVMDGFED